MWVEDYAYSDMSIRITWRGDIKLRLDQLVGEWGAGEHYDDSVDFFFFLDNNIMVYPDRSEESRSEIKYGRFSYDPNIGIT